MDGSTDALLGVAIAAALLYLEEEAARASAVPTVAPVKGRWAATDLPRRIDLPPVSRLRPGVVRPRPGGDAGG